MSRDVTGTKRLQLNQDTRQQAMLACLTAGRRSGPDEERERKKIRVVNGESSFGDALAAYIDGAGSGGGGGQRQIRFGTSHHA